MDPTTVKPTTVKPSVLAQKLDICLDINQAVCVWGQPGIGKSQIIAQRAAEKGLDFIDLRVVLLDPVDLRGLPMVKNGMSSWAQPDFLPREGRGVLLLDEINRAPILVQNACFQLVLDRKLGEYRVPDEWRIVAACNREKDGGGVTRMPQGLANRFQHFEVEPNLNDWCVWALENDIDPILIGFLRFRPHLLCEFDKDNHAFPTPRSWVFVNKILKHVGARDMDMAFAAGAVGEAAALEFISFMKLYMNLPNIDNIIMNPDSAPVPNDTATLYAVASALSARVDNENFARVVRYLRRVTPEYSVFAIKDAAVRDRSLTNNPDFTKWVIENAALLG